MIEMALGIELIDTFHLWTFSNRLSYIVLAIIIFFLITQLIIVDFAASYRVSLYQLKKCEQTDKKVNHLIF